MPTLALTALHRSMLAEITEGQVAYAMLGGGFTVGGAHANAACARAIVDLIQAGLAYRNLTCTDVEVPVKLTDVGKDAAR